MAGDKGHISAQAQILSDSILTFCSHVDDLSRFVNTLERICTKHVTRMVEPDHYEVLLHLFNIIIREEFTTRLSEEEYRAWDRALFAFASLLVSRERELYDHLERTDGYWKGFRTFAVRKLSRRDGRLQHFALTPLTEGQDLPYAIGQTICIRVMHEKYGYVYHNLCLKQGECDGKVHNHTALFIVAMSTEPFPTSGRIKSDGIVRKYLCEETQVEVSAPFGGCPILLGCSMDSLPTGAKRTRTRGGDRSPFAEGATLSTIPECPERKNDKG